MKALLLMTLLFSGSLQAKVFSNSYVSFNLPSNWSCHLDQTEWVCKSKLKTNSQGAEAIIILTAKEIGPSDSLNMYEAHLKIPKKIFFKNGKSKISKVLRVKKQKINNHFWIDGLHSNSEVDNFYTRYLATVKNPVAILVTFSAHYKHYTKYSKDFLNAIKSLRVTASRNLLKRRSTGAPTLGSSSQTLGPSSGQSEGLSVDDFDLPDDSSGGMSANKVILFLAILMLILGLYAYKKLK